MMNIADAGSPFHSDVEGRGVMCIGKQRTEPRRYVERKVVRNGLHVEV